MKAVTTRNRPGTFEEIVAEINRITVGWINYYGIGRMKTFIEDTEKWLHRRLRQLIWKRWKRTRTKYKMLLKYGISNEKTIHLAFSRKSYWRMSRNETLHQAIPTRKLIRWGLKSISHLYEKRYLKDRTAVYGTVRTVV